MHLSLCTQECYDYGSWEVCLEGSVDYYTTPRSYSYDCTFQYKGTEYCCEFDQSVGGNGCGFRKCSGSTLPFEICDLIAACPNLDSGIPWFTQPPASTPIAPPVTPPVAAPVAPPLAPPVAAPVAAPVAPPVAAPVSSPVASPVDPAPTCLANAVTCTLDTDCCSGLCKFRRFTPDSIQQKTCQSAPKLGRVKLAGQSRGGAATRISSTTLSGATRRGIRG